MNYNEIMSLKKKYEVGYLEIIIGPMFSGKTSKLLDLYKQYTFCNVKVAVINHSEDTRYDSTMLSSHDKVMIPCIQTTELTSLMKNDELYEADVILINEAQFFDDLYYFVVDMLKFNKKIYVSGLDGDFERKKFGKVLDLIPLCDKVTKMNSLCSLCKNGTPGLFSMRLTKEKEQMLIGSSNYIPVCRICYEENNFSV
jgi:thymidine kinase